MSALVGMNCLRLRYLCKFSFFGTEMSGINNSPHQFNMEEKLVSPCARFGF